MIGANSTTMAVQNTRTRSLCAVIVSWSLAILILAGGSQAQSIFLRVQRLNQNPRRVDGTDFYEFMGNDVQLDCFCENAGAASNPVITSLEWLKDGVSFRNQDCSTFTELIEEIDFSDEGRYECRATFANGTTQTKLAGRLHVIDPSIIQVPSPQYGLLDHNYTLNLTAPFLTNTTVSITWYRKPNLQTQLPSGNFINGVSLEDEGEYMCDVLLGAQDLAIRRDVNFIVLVPPTILQSPPPNYQIFGNQRKDLIIEFQSRFRVNTSITWYKNDQPIPDNSITTEYRSDPNASTMMAFNLIRRRDSGAYRVVIENKFGAIPFELQQRIVDFEVTVEVPPAVPSDLEVPSISSDGATVNWTRTNVTTDDAADRITLYVRYLNDTVARQLTLGGKTESHRIEDLVPGMSYTVSLSVHNQDGTRNTPSVQFQTQPGAPSVPTILVKRHSNISINLTASLAYTGGGDITHLIVEFRQLGTMEWINVGQIPAMSRSDSGLEIYIIVEDTRFSGIGIEFRVSAMNSHGHGSEPGVRMEDQVLPGSPSELSLLLTSYDALTISLQLSPDGTSPILGLLVEFSSHDNFVNISGPFTAGELLEVTIDGLEDGTTYVFTVAAYNFGGRGEASTELEGTTDKLPPIPLYGFVAIGVGFAVVLVVIVTIVVLVTAHCCKVKRKKREYYINPVPSADEKQLEPNHEMIKRTKLTSSPHSSSSTPSVLTAVTSSHSLFSQTPISPLRSGTESPRGQKFRLDAGSSVANSVNHDSDESEINAPRYTYTVSTPSPAESEAHLRAQSSHSVATVATCMSTRESLIYPVTESNATDV